MGFPRARNATPTTMNARNRIEDVSRELKTHHDGHFMVWNLSEEQYDYNLFDNQVMEFKFPGHPAPPLGLFFKICNSVESWLEADERNVAAIHCLVSCSRTVLSLCSVNSHWHRRGRVERPLWLLASLLGWGTAPGGIPLLQYVVVWAVGSGS